MGTLTFQNTTFMTRKSLGRIRNIFTAETASRNKIIVHGIVESILLGYVSRNVSYPGSKLFMGRFVQTTIPQNVERWVTKEKNDRTKKKRTNIKIVVVYKFPEVVNVQSTKLKTSFIRKYVVMLVSHEIAVLVSGLERSNTYSYLIQGQFR